MNLTSSITATLIVIGGLILGASFISGAQQAKSGIAEWLRTKGLVFGTTLLGVGILFGAISSGAW